MCFVLGATLPAGLSKGCQLDLALLQSLGPCEFRLSNSADAPQRNNSLNSTGLPLLQFTRTCLTSGYVLHNMQQRRLSKPSKLTQQHSSSAVWRALLGLALPSTAAYCMEQWATQVGVDNMIATARGPSIIQCNLSSWD